MLREINDFLRYVIDPGKVKALILLMQCVALLMLIGCRAQQGYDKARYEAEAAAAAAAHDAEIQELTAKAEAGIYATQYLPDDAKTDVLPLARYLGCLEELYPGITIEAKSLACWGPIRRVESSEYPDDLECVLLQPGQFNEYDPDAIVTEENYTIAYNQISRWLNGDISPCGKNAVYIKVSAEGVELRDAWDEGSRCNKWRA